MSNYKPYWKKHPVQLRIFSAALLLLAPITFLYLAVLIVAAEWDVVKQAFAELWLAAKGEEQ